VSWTKNANADITFMIAYKTCNNIQSDYIRRSTSIYRREIISVISGAVATSIEAAESVAKAVGPFISFNALEHFVRL
jgi:hypothetical protein